MGLFRKLFIWIDGIAFGFIDDAYKLILGFATGEILSLKEITNMWRNLYIIVGIFALFRIALLLINAIIDPEKLFEKSKGVTSIFFRVVIMLVMLVAAPIIFSELTDLQRFVMNKNILPKLIIGNEVFSEVQYDKDGNAVKVKDQKNAEKIAEAASMQMRNAAISSLISVNHKFVSKICVSDSTGEQITVTNTDKDTGDADEGECQKKKGHLTYLYNYTANGTRTGGYLFNSSCTEQCTLAVDEYNKQFVGAKNDGEGGIDLKALKTYINVQATPPKQGEDDEPEKEYVYDYTIILTTIVGGFITYILVSFALDLAVRIFELAVLQIAAPLFIVTFIDPKSSSSGPFNKWLKAFGSSYAALFIKIAIVFLIILFMSLINKSNIFDSNSFLASQHGLAKIVLICGALIFAKKAPKWICDMLGIQGGDFGGLSIGKKLTGGMIGGGLLSKAAGKVKGVGNNLKKKGIDATKRNAKNLANRGIGRIAASRAAGKAYKDAHKDNAKLAERLKAKHAAANAASANMKTAQKAQAPIWFSGIKDTYAQGAAIVDPDYKTGREKKLKDLKGKADAQISMAATLNPTMDPVKHADMLKEKKDQKVAKMFSKDGNLITDSSGARKKVAKNQHTFGDGSIKLNDVYANPESDGQWNATIGYATKMEAAYKSYGAAQALARGYTIDQNNMVIDSNNKVISSVEDFGRNSMSTIAEKKLEAMVANNQISLAKEYFDNKESYAKALEVEATAITRHEETKVKLTGKLSASQNALSETKSTIERFLNGRDPKNLTGSEKAAYDDLIVVKNTQEQEVNQYTNGLKVNDDSLAQATKQRETYEDAMKAAYDKIQSDFEPLKDANGNVVKDKEGKNVIAVEFNGRTYNINDTANQNAVMEGLNLKYTKANKKYNEAKETYEANEGRFKSDDKK